MAIYSKIRLWPSNKLHRDAIAHVLNVDNTNLSNEESQIKELLEYRKYIVLQGAQVQEKHEWPKN